MQDTGAIFVRVDEPLYLRKSLIKAMIDDAEIKKQELKLKKIRHAKLIEINKLKSIIMDIINHIEFLDRNALPAEETRDLPAHLNIKKPVIKKQVKVVKKPVKGLTELDRLRMELNEIDDRLSSLEF